MSKSLVIFYSRAGQNYVNGSIVALEKGNSRVLAEMIKDLTNADLFEIETVKEYSKDYMTCTEEAKAELKTKARPELKNTLDDISAYENIFLCGPCWWGTYPCAMFTQLERLDFTEKKVFPVMTHEGSAMGSSERDLKRICKGAKLVKGLAVKGSEVHHAKNMLEAWIKKNM